MVRAEDGPTIVATEFKDPPSSLSYFKDSNVILFQEAYGRTIWRSADGGTTWSKAEGIEHEKAVALVMHEYDPNRAYVLTASDTHWKTHDRGETWQTFSTGAYTSDFADSIGRWMKFHADDPDKILFTGMECEGLCEELVMYTTNGFEDKAKALRRRTQACWWAKSSPLFTTGQDELDKQRILCIIRGGIFSPQSANRLLISDNFFAQGPDGIIQEFEPNLNGEGAVEGIVSIVEVKKYLLVAVTSRNTAEMALYVSGDTLKWHRAIFPHDHPLLEASYTVLESTNYSVQIDVRSSRRMSKPMGTLLTSNSNGTYFTRNIEHTNRNMESYVDFEKVSDIQGIYLVNQVDNWKEVEEDQDEKKIKTKITFDDGRTFELIKTGDDEIHLHSVTEISNVGPVFSSPAPGLIMGIGNHGSHLKGYWDSRLYISDDAGRTWIEGPEGPHKYEFGDQGSILLAVRDSKEADIKEIRYSLDHGKNWDTAKLPKDLSILPWALTTTQDSTSLKFLLTARKGSKASPNGFFVISIDFEGLHENTCKESDMEDWFARVDDDGKPSCVMGHTQKYHRRKKDAKCFIKQEFKDPVPEFTPCECTDADFECDFNFVRDGDECKPAGPVVVPEGACKADGSDETFMGSSGWRLIPGNECKRSGGDQKDKQKEWKCSDTKTPPNAPNSDEPGHTQWPFEGDFDRFSKHYLERGESSSEGDETILAWPYRASTGEVGDIFITHDHGKNWTKVKLPGKEGVQDIITHPYVKDMAFFLTKENKVFYTVDHGQHFDYFEPRDPPDTSYDRAMPLAFHPDQRDWLIWHGKKCHGNDCYLEASLSKDRGDNWQTIKRYVKKCEFTGSSAYKFRNTTQIVCLASKREDNESDNPLQLLYSDEFPRYEMSVALENVSNFATMAEFIVVATENTTDRSLNALASLNGRDYAPARFPYNIDVPHTNAYTVLESSTHAVNLFVVTEEQEKLRYGSILKSNSNGTSYVLSIAGVNCDDSYYVDFEKMLGLEGVVLVNTVANRDSDSEPKKLQTRISHNDGAEWGFLPPPERDLDGKPFSCQSKIGHASCALHVHGYTERVDARKTYSSESAIGIMFGIGNVGPFLGEAKDADTFMTTDAGLSWKMVKRGSWTWSFGDQGSIIVLAQRNTKTKSVSYSLDQGDTWKTYTFSEGDVVITDITTLRSGSSRNFLLWGHQGDKLFTVNLDFSGLASETCKDDEDRNKSDYELWSPEHPLQSNHCLFGHKNYYLRKKKDRKCYNGGKLNHLYSVENCECTRQDFECDYNFELDKHGHCSLVEGLTPLDPVQVCKENPDEFEYYEPSGFRRIPLTTCSGGFEADKVLTPHPCPGHEEEFERKRGVSGVGLFFAIIIPISLAAAAGWWVYRNWRGKFGQIRLGEQNGFGSDAPWVKYPVIAVSGVVAVVGALPLLAGSLWRVVSSAWDRARSGRDGGGRYDWLRGNSQRRFTTRDSFARGRGDYAIVDEDEGELLGDDSDEEV